MSEIVTRRGALAVILAYAMAPAIVRADSLMKIVPIRDTVVLTPGWHHVAFTRQAKNVLFYADEENHEILHDLVMPEKVDISSVFGGSEKLLDGDFTLECWVNLAAGSKVIAVQNLLDLTSGQVKYVDEFRISKGVIEIARS